jgi:hypothetical protein
MTEIGCGVTRSFLDSPEEDRCLASGCALPGYTDNSVISKGL